MNRLFAETLRRLRTERGISQSQLGKQLFVNHSTVARWESGSRLPDASMIPRWQTPSAWMPTPCLTLRQEAMKTRMLSLWTTAGSSSQTAFWFWRRSCPTLRSPASSGLWKQRKTDTGSEIIIADNGRGFAPSDDSEPHIALKNIRQRLEMMCRGSLAITRADGGGTIVTVTIPDAAKSHPAKVTL